MRNAGRYVFRCARDAHLEITRVFDFVQPTIIALWNLRWQVRGFLLQVPGVTSTDLASRFALGSEMRGGELKRACVETPWDRQKSDFAEFVLITIIAAFEEYTARIAELAVPPSRQRNVSKNLQFPTRLPATPIAQLVQPSAALRGVFSRSTKKNSKYSIQTLDNLLICYRFFKTMRNVLAHNGGVANQETVDTYNEFRSIGNVSSLGLAEVPVHHPIILGQPVKLELRGVIGLSDVILRIITTYDADLSESSLAEREVIDRIPPVPKKRQLVKATLKEKRYLIHSPQLRTSFSEPDTGVRDNGRRTSRSYLVSKRSPEERSDIRVFTCGDTRTSVCLR